MDKNDMLTAADAPENAEMSEEVMEKLKAFMQGNYNSQEIANAVKKKIDHEENK